VEVKGKNGRKILNIEQGISNDEGGEKGAGGRIKKTKDRIGELVNYLKNGLFAFSRAIIVTGPWPG